MPVYALSEELVFPDPVLATDEGLLAIGGDLTPERLVLAYTHGIFPWYNVGDPILWWCPDPRYVLDPDEIVISRSMRALLRRHAFRVTLDRAFPQVVAACAGPSIGRAGEGTWITRDMAEAYTRLHQHGLAHSVEVWQDDRLAGGLYGVSLGRIFYGESMFSRVSNASKYGFITLVGLLKARGFELIDCQQGTRHLISLGAKPMARTAFLQVLDRQNPAFTRAGSWADWITEGDPTGGIPQT